jgi:NADPH-dependent 2,4-dienoyl-CoA reductase/sulfur reductase-like enzyme
VIAAGGDELRWDALVVATGARPRRLPGDDDARHLRTLDDALALRDELRPGARVVVVGAGWIGAEVATAATSLGCHVTVLEAGRAPLASALGARVGGWTVPWWAAAGVDLRLGTRVVAFGSGHVDAVGSAGTERVPCDVVLVAIGARPDVAWLADAARSAAGLPSRVPCRPGVLVDEYLRAGAPGVWAVGDCTTRWSPRAEETITGEHWDDALHAPETLVPNVLAGWGRPGHTFDPVSYVWSEQFGRTLQLVGRPAPTDTLVVRSAGSGPGAGASDAPIGDAWAACWLRAGRLVAVAAVGRPRDVRVARRLIAAGAEVDAAALADVSRPLTALG